MIWIFFYLLMTMAYCVVGAIVTIEMNDVDPHEEFVWFILGLVSWPGVLWLIFTEWLFKYGRYAPQNKRPDKR